MRVTINRKKRYILSLTNSTYARDSTTPLRHRYRIILRTSCAVGSIDVIARREVCERAPAFAVAVQTRLGTRIHNAGISQSSWALHDEILYAPHLCGRPRVTSSIHCHSLDQTQVQNNCSSVVHCSCTGLAIEIFYTDPSYF